MERKKEKYEGTLDFDLVAKMQAEIDTLREENIKLKTINEQHIKFEEQSASKQKSRNNETKMSKHHQRQVKKTDDVYAQLYGSPAIEIEDKKHRRDLYRKIFAVIAIVVIFLVLYNYIGLFGIAAIGLLASGIIKK
jgi:hypothetical protein